MARLCRPGSHPRGLAMPGTTEKSSRPSVFVGLLGLVAGVAIFGVIVWLSGESAAPSARDRERAGSSDEAVTPPSRPPAQPESAGGSEATPVRRLPGLTYEPRQGLDIGGFSTVMPRA